MKYILSVIIGLLLLVSLLHLGVFGLHTNVIRVNNYPQIDTTGVVNIKYLESHSLFTLRTSFDRSKSLKIVKEVLVEQHFYGFSNLNIDSNSNMKIMVAGHVINGVYDKNEIAVEITQAQFLQFRNIGMTFIFLFFILQTWLSYLIFRIVFSYCRKKFYSEINANRFLALGIITTILGLFFYTKGFIQQVILNCVLGTKFRIFPKEVLEYFPYVLILGLFIIVVSRFYKDAVLVKKQNDLTI